jgi:hypothetical protein
MVVKQVKVGVVVLLLAAMGGLSVGCTAPSSDPQSQNQAQLIGNFFFFLIYRGLCDSNGGVCPFPLGPSDPPFQG